MKVHVIQTGVANTASVRAAFERLGCDVECTHERSAVLEADYLVLPGVGTFEAGIDALDKHELMDPLRQRIDMGQPTLAICLGLQMLALHSQESPGISGLGVIETSVTAFPDDICVPQFGWNKVQPGAPALGAWGYVYFANSYRIASVEKSEWAISSADYGGPFCAALQRGRILACQFHPELSGGYGQEIIQSWLKGNGQC